jgi:hypothetical protein
MRMCGDERSLIRLYRSTAALLFNRCYASSRA